MMSAKLAMFLAQAAGGVRPQDVFATNLYTGNGSTQTITNGINLSGEGGLVWGKVRSTENSHWLYDTVRGTERPLTSDNTNPAANNSGANFGVTSFNSNGFTIGSGDAGARWNTSPNTYATWTFRRAPKFFDVVTYTGNGSSSQTINHNLGVTPGMIIVKRTDGSGAWSVWHRTFGTKDVIFLEQTAAVTTYGSADPIVVSSTSFTVGNNQIIGNGSGWAYVAYLFAHDTDSSGVVQCGSFTTDGSGAATVNLGWGPQFAIVKCSSSADSWWMWDTTRGWTGSSAFRLLAESSSAESSLISAYTRQSNGFSVSGVSASRTFIYLAIREPT